MLFLDDTYEWDNVSLAEYLSEGNVPSGWKDFFNREDIQNDLGIISEEIDENRGDTIYPSIDKVFKAFYMTPLDKVKAVIIGMDPYHNGSAVGLCFSVKNGNPINPSLRSIYRELKEEGYNPIEDGDLTHWAKQGVLMLNMALTVLKGKAGSHTSIWYDFSEKVVKYIDEKRGDKVQWILMGSDAHQVKDLIRNGIKHCTSHPMPLAAGRSSNSGVAFWGSGVFKKVKGVEW